MCRANQYGGVPLRNKVWAAVFAMLGSVSYADEGESVTLVAFGDSLIQGYGLAQGDGFVPQLQAWLEGQGLAVSVINAGVSGDTTRGGLSRVSWTLTPEVDGMIVTLGGNDFLRGLDPAASRANIEGIIDAAQAEGVDVLLTGMQAPGNYGPVYKQDFDAIYPELAEEKGVLLFDSFFAGLGSDDPAALGALMQADGIHPNREGVGQIVEALGPSVIALIEGLD